MIKIITRPNEIFPIKNMSIIVTFKNVNIHLLINCLTTERLHIILTHMVGIINVHPQKKKNLCSLFSRQSI